MTCWGEEGRGGKKNETYEQEKEKVGRKIGRREQKKGIKEGGISGREKRKA